MRYNNTERLGVIETDKIVTKDIGWIFREQPIIDVGLDAILEEVENGEPTGKFLAVQIKTGPANFYKTEKALSHYVSNIHYNYWINLSIPIIIIAHLPNENETYWQEISKSKFKKNKRQWKIEIPIVQKFNEKAKPKLRNLLSTKNDKRFKIFVGENDLDDELTITEDMKCLNEATICMNKITEITGNQTKITTDLATKIRSFTIQKINISDPRVTSTYKGYANSLVITAKRLENEIELFSHLYSVGVFAFEKIVSKIHHEGLSFKKLKIDTTSITNIIPITESAINSFSEVKRTASEIDLNGLAFKEAKKQFIEVLDLICSELTAAKNITENLIEKINRE